PYPLALSMNLQRIVTKKHASSEVIAYCLHMHFHQGLSCAKLARVFHKSKSTISTWISDYLTTGKMGRIDTESVIRKFGLRRREWLVDLYMKNPTLFLNEVKHLFEIQFPHTTISKSSICIILRSAGMTWQVIEVRTFDGLKFLSCCKEFALKNPQVFTYPGPHSVWILDCAKIHCDKNLVYYLRSLGIVVIFLPAYCPFFNPIEVMFGLVKQRMQCHYVEGQKKPLLLVIMEVLNEFVSYKFEP
ncbi:Serine kinase, partial [Podochytrium sp. JEL0797]